MRHLKIAAYLLIAAGMGIFWVGGQGDGSAIQFVGGLTIVFGILVHFRARQHASRARAAAVLGDDRPDVLYLRAFSADVSSNFKALWYGFATDEEQLAEVLKPFGDLVAIGRPAEGLPPPGAAREYYPDDQWQGAVRTRIASAPLVVLRAGLGDGLLWEMEHVVRAVDPRRFLLWIQDLSKADYATFCARVRERLGLALPPLPTFSALDMFLNIQNRVTRVRPGFIRFSSSWQPTPLPAPRTRAILSSTDLRRPLSLALRPVFEEWSVPWRAPGWFR